MVLNSWTKTMGGVVLIALVAGGVATRGSKAAQRSATSSVMASTGRSSNSSKRAVLVELFTSEGCSSCPSADILLARLQKEQPIPNVDIVPLSEHVDYWNSIGWKDPFSSVSYTERQQNYARSFRLQQVYTPQMVVAGQSEFVGSESAHALAAIRRAATLPQASVQISQPVSTPSDTKNEQVLQVRVDGLPAVTSGDMAGVLLAITENNLSSNVRSGENAGHTLPHTAVVRQLTLLGEATTGHPFASASTIKLDPNWKRRDLSAVVFVQEKGTRHILGAARLSLAP